MPNSNGNDKISEYGKKTQFNSETGRAAGKKSYTDRYNKAYLQKICVDTMKDKDIRAMMKSAIIKARDGDISASEFCVKMFDINANMVSDEAGGVVILPEVLPDNEVPESGDTNEK